MYCKDDYILKKLEKRSSIERMSELLDTHEHTLRCFLRGQTSIGKKKFSIIRDELNLTDTEIMEHAEACTRDNVDRWPEIDVRLPGRGGWYDKATAEKENARARHKAMQDSLEYKVMYCRRANISYGELQRRLYFHEVLIDTD